MLTPELEALRKRAIKRGRPPSRLYVMWVNMLRRPTAKYALKYPSYAGTLVSEEFQRFSDFSEWVVRQHGWDFKGYEIDKDLLVKGNRIYSPGTCVFIPHAINSLLTKADRKRGALPIGVLPSGRKFRSQLNVNGKTICIGTFLTPQEAFAAYKAAKEAEIKRKADQYRREIDPRAYAALLAYQVEITD